MNGIYIKGMEMPQGDEVITIFPDGSAHRHHLGLQLHISESKAVPVPDHGRLVDADALPYTRLYKDNWIRGTGREAPAVWKEDVDSAPTIIPASKEAEK